MGNKRKLDESEFNHLKKRRATPAASDLPPPTAAASELPPPTAAGKRKRSHENENIEFIPLIKRPATADLPVKIAPPTVDLASVSDQQAYAPVVAAVVKLPVAGPAAAAAAADGLEAGRCMFRAAAGFGKLLVKQMNPGEKLYQAIARLGPGVFLTNATHFMKLSNMEETRNWAREQIQTTCEVAKQFPVLKEAAGAAEETKLSELEELLCRELQGCCLSFRT